jgi:hypothetical protein
MHLSKLTSNFFFRLTTLTIPLIFTAPVFRVFAGPALYFYYEYLNLNVSDCMGRGYQFLESQNFQIPSNVDSEGKAIFAIGENQNMTIIIDCSEVAQSGRITVMASSHNQELTLDYLKNILNIMKNQ